MHKCHMLQQADSIHCSSVWRREGARHVLFQFVEKCSIIVALVRAATTAGAHQQSARKNDKELTAVKEERNVDMDD
jgi:hypothetical protein